MVSKYRDILDPDMLQKMTIGSMSSDELEKRLESIEKGSGTRAEENNHEDVKKTSLPSDLPPSGGGEGDTEEKKPSENNVDEVESLRQMLAGLTGTKYEKVENIGDRKMNQISSVRFPKNLALSLANSTKKVCNWPDSNPEIFLKPFVSWSSFWII